jgi:hypothetical protein
VFPVRRTVTSERIGVRAPWIPLILEVIANPTITREVEE